MIVQLKTYYYSVVCLNESYDTIHISTSCQVLSLTEQEVFFKPISIQTQNILDSLDFNNPKAKKYILIDEEIVYQKGNYPVAIGTISYR